MVQDGQKPDLQGTDALEKAPTFLIDLERRFEAVRAEINALVRYWRKLAPSERSARMLQIRDTSLALETQILSLAKNRGEHRELEDEIRALKDGVKRDPHGRLDVESLITTRHQVLGALQGWLERHSMLLTLLPIPIDFSDQLIAAVERELHARARAMARGSSDEQPVVPGAETRDEDDAFDEFDLFPQEEEPGGDEPPEKGS